MGVVKSYLQLLPSTKNKTNVPDRAKCRKVQVRLHKEYDTIVPLGLIRCSRLWWTMDWVELYHKCWFWNIFDTIAQLDATEKIRVVRSSKSGKGSKVLPKSNKNKPTQEDLFYCHCCIILIDKNNITYFRQGQFISFERLRYLLLTDQSGAGWSKGPYFNCVSTFLTIFDQLSNLVSMCTK